MNRYLVEMCKVDGTTPVGECPEYEIAATDIDDARGKALTGHPDEEIVSIGLKSDIQNSRVKYGW